MNNEHKPCPFCGSRDLSNVDYAGRYGVLCNDCDAAGPTKHTPDTAWHAWDNPEATKYSDLREKTKRREYTVGTLICFGQDKVKVHVADEEEWGGTCEGCVIQEKYPDCSTSLDMPFCCAGERADKQDVIFKEVNDETT